MASPPKLIRISEVLSYKQINRDEKA
jgi:hypothetical protein